MRREQYGQSSERRARLIDQMELQLEELEADATEDEIAAERVAAKITNVCAFERRRPARKPFPEHLPRERLVIEAPEQCACCGSARIVKMGEDITETLEVIPRDIVKLTSEHDRRQGHARHHSYASDFRPQAHGRGTQFAVMAGGDVVARDVEQVGNRIMDGDEAL